MDLGRFIKHTQHFAGTGLDAASYGPNLSTGDSNQMQGHLHHMNLGANHHCKNKGLRFQPFERRGRAASGVGIIQFIYSTK